MIEAVLSFLIEGLLEVLAEALLSGIIELAFDLLFGLLGESRLSDDWHRMIKTKLTLAAMLGAMVGAISVLVQPRRILPAAPVAGISVVLSPIVAGILMGRYGEWRRSRGSATSLLATFWGGALFALGLASVRFYFLD